MRFFGKCGRRYDGDFFGFRSRNESRKNRQSGEMFENVFQTAENRPQERSTGTVQDAASDKIKVPVQFLNA